MKKFIYSYILFLAISTASAEPSLKDVKMILESTRQEVIEFGEKFNELALESDEAYSKSDICALVDIFIRMSLYILDKGKEY